MSVDQASGASARLLADGQLLEQAIKGLQDLQQVLDGISDGALSPEFWLVARMAFADAAAYRQISGDCDPASEDEDKALRDRYAGYLEMLGGTPHPWPEFG